MRVCKVCGCDNPSEFYETQHSNYCRVHHKEKYFAPGRARLLEAKLARGGCADCSLIATEENSVVFDFDHTGQKVMNVSKMTTMSTERFEAEIAKCVLRCSNCHRLKTKGEPRTYPTPGRPRRNVLAWAAL